MSPVLQPVASDTLAPPVDGSGALVQAMLDEPDALVYFLLNVGDGDTQLLLLPPDSNDRERRLVASAYDEPFDLVVLDPPREGAKRAVVDAVVARDPRRIAYVACDPAALARDLALLAGHGYELRGLRAFDLFPMTHHVECVALLEKAGSHLR